MTRAKAHATRLRSSFPTASSTGRATATTSSTSRGAKRNTAGVRARFLEEARVLAQFRHPNIVGVHRVFEANGTVYMQLEFIAGRTLENWLREIDTPPMQDELDLILGPILDALEHVHANGIHHLDISPENIMIASSDGRPMLLDFGAARLDIKRHSQLLSAMVYKAGYSAPEQYAQTGSRLGPWTDIYALAATTYRAIAGERPSEAPMRQMDDDYVSISTRAKSAYRQSFLTRSIGRCVCIRRNARSLLWRGGPGYSASARRPGCRYRTRKSLPARRLLRGRHRPERIVVPAAAGGAVGMVSSNLTAPVRQWSPVVPVVIAAALLTGAGVVYALLSDGSDKGGSTGGGTRYSDLPERPDSSAPHDKDADKDTSPPSEGSKSKMWGAVARRDASFTAHWNHNTKEDARQAALDACKKFDGKAQCDVVAAFTAQWCWALARANKDRTKWNWSTGAAIDAARDAAKAACDKRATAEGGCEISLQFCSDGSNIYSDRNSDGNCLRNSPGALLAGWITMR